MNKHHVVAVPQAEEARSVVVPDDATRITTIEPSVSIDDSALVHAANDAHQRYHRKALADSRSDSALLEKNKSLTPKRTTNDHFVSSLSEKFDWFVRLDPHSHDHQDSNKDANFMEKGDYRHKAQESHRRHQVARFREISKNKAEIIFSSSSSLTEGENCATRNDGNNGSSREWWWPTSPKSGVYSDEHGASSSFASAASLFVPITSSSPSSSVDTSSNNNDDFILSKRMTHSTMVRPSNPTPEHPLNSYPVRGCYLFRPIRQKEEILLHLLQQAATSDKDVKNSIKKRSKYKKKSQQNTGEGTRSISHPLYRSVPWRDSKKEGG